MKAEKKAKKAKSWSPEGEVAIRENIDVKIELFDGAEQNCKSQKLTHSMHQIGFICGRVGSGFEGIGPDDQPCVAHLQTLGIQVTPVPWSTPPTSVPALNLAFLLVRTPWDYSWQCEAFLSWIEEVAGLGVILYNDPKTIRANADKRYLIALAENGVKTVDSLLITANSSPPALPEAFRGGMIVVKPTVSGGAKDTFLIDCRDYEDVASSLLKAGHSVFVQPFVQQIQERGECSLVFFDGEFSHAVRKVPRAGDFRVQPQHGGITTPLPLSPDAQPRKVAEAILKTWADLQDLSTPLLYARVDILEVQDGDWRLMELELIEPRLFLLPEFTATGAQNLAQAIQKKLK
jgi:glutathione synthase/RimK-type ligase-like ATP-grasp enzyme